MSAEVVPNDRLLGQVLGERYQILSRLGEGAMGVVYKARHVKVGRMFAIKVLHQRVLADTKVALRFEREAELAGRLRHPNVVGVVDVGDVHGTRYMVMDFAEGPDLAKLLDEAPMPPARIVHLVRQLLEGLYHAHEQGLIHRDFKPENVIVERDAHGAEVPRIVDFGIALLREGGDSTDGVGRLTTNGLVLGTPHYMAPEQAVADPIDHRIDLFALGIVVYEMLSGRLPFDGNGAEVARANLLVDPPAISRRVPHLEVDPLLEAFARRLMAKSRRHRPATAKAARELLDLIERDRPAAARGLGVPVARSGREAALTEPVIAGSHTGALDSSVTTPMKPTPRAGAPISMSGRPAVPWPAGGDPISAPWSAAGGVDRQAGAEAAGAEVAGAAGPAAAYPGQIVRVPASLPYPGSYAYGTPARDTDLRTPLGWPAEAHPGRRRSWLIGGILVGTASIAAATILSLTGGNPDEPAIDRTVAAGSAVPGTIAGTEPAGSASDSVPAAAAPRSPADPAIAPAPGAVPRPPGTNPPPAPGVAAALRAPRVDPRVAPAPGGAATQAVERKPRGGSSDGRRPSAPPGRGIDAEASPGSEPVTHPEIVSAGVPAPATPISAAAPVAPREPRPRDPDAAGPDARAAKPDAPRPAAAPTPAPAPVGITAGGLGVLFEAVGREIRQLPADDQVDLLDRLSRVDIMAEMRGPGVRRDRVAAELTQIRDEVHRRRGGHKKQ